MLLRRFASSSAVLIAAASLLCTAPASPSTPASSSAGQALPPLPISLPPATRTTLSNGLRVVVVRDPIGPVATVEVSYLVGSADSPAGFPGMAHAQEHMLFRGGSDISATQDLDISAELGGDEDASTYPTVTQFFSTVPADDLGTALHLQASRMRDAADAQTDWAVERGAIEQEVAEDFSSAIRQMADAIDGAAFAGTPFAIDGVGTQPSFDATTGPMLKSFFTQWYGPNNAIVVVAGDVDPAATLAQIKADFADIPSRPTPVRAPVVLSPLHDASVTISANVVYHWDFIGVRLPGATSPEYAAGQVLSDVLQSPRGAVASVVASGQALDADFSQDESLPFADLGTTTIITPTGSDSSGAVDAVRHAFVGYAASGVPEDLVQAAKLDEMVQDARTFASIPGTAQMWSDALAVDGSASPYDEIRAIQAVTKADVDRVAAEHLSGDQLISGAFTPSNSYFEPDAPASESSEPSDANSVGLPDWAAASLLTVHPSAAEAPTSELLPNGVRLIVLPVAGDASVDVLGDVRTAPQLEEPPGKEGVSEMMDRLFTYGSVSLDREQFASAIDAIGARENPGTRFSIELLGADLDRGMQLLADGELHPGFPAAAFDTVKKQVTALATDRQQALFFDVDRELLKGLYGASDAALRETTGGSAGSVTLDDVRNFYEMAFRPDLATIVVVGGVTPVTARDEVEKWFGGWNATGEPPAVELPVTPANGPSSVKLYSSALAQDIVTMRETVGIRRSDPDYFALSLGDELLGGTTLASRLYDDLRVQRGLVYSVSSSFDAGATRSTFTIDFACNPADLDKVTDLIRQDIVQLQTVDIQPDLLQRTKAFVVRRLSLDRGSESDIADALLDDAEAGLPIDEPSLAASAYLSISADDLRSAFARWIRPDGFVRVVASPAG